MQNENNIVVVTKVTVQDVLKGKFSKTISRLNAEKQEAVWRAKTRNDYSPDGVYNRINEIFIQFNQELSALAAQSELQ